MNGVNGYNGDTVYTPPVEQKRDFRPWRAAAAAAGIGAVLATAVYEGLVYKAEQGANPGAAEAALKAQGWENTKVDGVNGELVPFVGECRQGPPRASIEITARTGKKIGHFVFCQNVNQSKPVPEQR